jgi:hypothetical protein
MPDEIDLAQQNSAMALDLAQQAIRAKADRPEVEATGECLNCERPLKAGLRWCNAACRDDWQRFSGRSGA